MNPNATVFPQCIGMGSIFNCDLMQEIADVIGKQAYIMGIRQTYAPNIDFRVIRDGSCGRKFWIQIILLLLTMI